MKKPLLICFGITLLALSLGSCKKKGCTDSTADNYNENASKDDGSCEYSAPIIGDETITVTNFSLNNLLGSSKSQEFPKIVLNGSGKGVLWAESPSPCEIKFVGLNTTFSADGSAIAAVANTGTTSSPTDIDLNLAYSTSANKYMATYIHAQSGDYGLRGKVFTPVDASDAEFDIEGGFTYGSDRPRYPIAEAGSSGKIGITYHSSSGTATPSTILFKTIDVSGSTPIVTPAAGSTQTGINVSGTDTDALFPDMAWNATSNIYGIVYMVGSGNNRKIKFVTVDGDGNIVTAAKVLIAAEGFEVQQPRIAADGSGFAIIWRDFRQVQIGNFEPLTGVPAVRFARCDASGNLISTSGTADLYDPIDQSLLVSNPYSNEVSIYADLAVKTSGTSYGLTWATQTSPYGVYFSEVRVSGGTTSASVESKVSNANSSDRVSIGSDGSKFVLVYSAAASGGGYETVIGVSN